MEDLVVSLIHSRTTRKQDFTGYTLDTSHPSIMTSVRHQSKSAHDQPNDRFRNHQGYLSKHASCKHADIPVAIPSLLHELHLDIHYPGTSRNMSCSVSTPLALDTLTFLRDDGYLSDSPSSPETVPGWTVQEANLGRQSLMCSPTLVESLFPFAQTHDQ